MAGKWEASVGQLRLIDGVRQEDPANMAVVDRHAIFPFRRRGKGRLVVLVELSGGAFGREELCRELVEAITEEYFHTPGTITYGLRQAVLLANTHLTRENAKVSSEHRMGGVACVVLRNGELFVAQAGWPMVYLVHREQVQAFPDTMLESEDTSMLGQHQTTNVRLFHAPVHPKDMVLMVDGPMARQLGITRIGQILAGSVQQAMRNLEILAPPEDCTAIVIHMSGTDQDSVSQAERWAFMEVEHPEQQAKDVPDTTPPLRMPDQAEYGRHLVPIVDQEQDNEPALEQKDIEPPPPIHEPRSFAPERAPAGAAFADQAAALARNIGQGIRTLGTRMLPEKEPRTEARRAQQRRTAARARRRGPDQRQIKWWIVAAVAIPVLALIVAGSYTWYRNWSEQSQFDAKLEAARSKRGIAVSSIESPIVARDYWLEVIALANDADQIRAGDVEVQQLRTQAEVAIDVIDGVTRLGQSFKLYEYTVPASSPNRVIVAGLDAYVLDRGTGYVYHHALNDLRNALRNPSVEQVLIQRGQPVDGQPVDNLIDMAWMKDGGERQAGALLILDAQGLLLEYDPTWEQFQSSTVGGVEGWRSPTALSTFDSNLYLLDPMANQIFKYWNQQYDGEPTRWIAQEGVDISTAIDMGIDGSIFLLHQDGLVTKYFGGEVATFSLTRMPLPLSSTDALYLDIEEVARYIYIADSSERRVVQLDREGVFVRQFKPAREQEENFRQLADVFVDEIAGKLYYVAANALYVTDIQPPQR